MSLHATQSYGLLAPLVCRDFQLMNKLGVLRMTYNDNKKDAKPVTIASDHLIPDTTAVEKVKH